MRGSSDGFTLVELLIVVLIIGTLLVQAIKFYTPLVENVRKAEAVVTLSALRGSELRYRTEHGRFSDDIAPLDFDPTEELEGAKFHFSYRVTRSDEKTFEITATRNDVDGGDGESTVTINQAGELGGTF